MAGLSLEGVWKRYGAVEAVRDLSLACAQGEMLALLGPSGCGKSSTLKMIAGIEPVSGGAIRFDSTDVSALDPARRNVAMVFEDYSLYPHLSVAGNVAFPLEVRGADRDTIRLRVDAALELLGLAEMRDANVRALSGGAQQRVAIGRALVREPALVLFDEPLSHLDADQKAQLRTEIKRLQQAAGLTSVLVTHDQTEAMSMSDRVAVMNHGVLQQVDSPERIYEWPANVFVAGFIGEPAMNLLAAAVRREGDRFALALGEDLEIRVTPSLTSRLSGRLRSQSVIAGIRPEHVRLAPAAQPNGWLRGVVAVREPRGDTDVLTVQVGPSVLAVELTGPSDWREGDAVAIELPAERLHFFDAESGANIFLEAA